MAEWRSVKAYARDRGCSPAAVRKAALRLGISRDAEGRINVAEAERLWPRGEEPEEGEPGEGTEGEPGVITYAEARRRRELAKAQREELELARLQGSLVSIDYLDQQLAGCLQRTRQVLLNLPGKIAPQLVSVPTVARAQMLLQQAIDEAMPTLQAIGEDSALDDDAPDGPGEVAG